MNRLPSTYALAQRSDRRGRLHHLAYKIVEKIGEGGVEVDYKTGDTKPKRLVALKFLAAHLLQDEEARKRFLLHSTCAWMDVERQRSHGAIIGLDPLSGGVLLRAVTRTCRAVPPQVGRKSVGNEASRYIRCPHCSRLCRAFSGDTMAGVVPVASTISWTRQQASSAMNQKQAESTLCRLPVNRPWCSWMTARLDLKASTTPWP